MFRLALESATEWERSATLLMVVRTAVLSSCPMRCGCSLGFDMLDLDAFHSSGESIDFRFSSVFQQEFTLNGSDRAKLFADVVRTGEWRSLLVVADLDTEGLGSLKEVRFMKMGGAGVY